jgi:hypothetical protein
MSEPQRRPDYPGRDASIIANNIFKQLCDLPEGWHGIRPLAMNVGVFANSEDVTYVAEAVLEQSGFIECNPEKHDIRLTGPGRDNCRVGIEVLPSDLQWLRQRLAQLGLDFYTIPFEVG